MIQHSRGSPFKSFLQGGFECAAPITENKVRLDILKATKHDELVAQDYELLKSIGMTTVREGFSWWEIDNGDGNYNFERFIPFLQAAKSLDMQIIWDLSHFDYPPHLDPFSFEFVESFKNYSVACLKLIKEYDIGQIVIVPINEISFFSWIGADMGWWAPHSLNRGFEFKYNLVKAAIAGMQAMRQIDPTILFMHVDPVVTRMAYNKFNKIENDYAKGFRMAKFQAWDMLTGKSHPELGGKKEYANFLGANYYIGNQEFIKHNKATDEVTYSKVGWNSKRRLNLKTILGEVYSRYKIPIVISETGSYGTLRKAWWHRTFRELQECLDSGLNIQGICAYPIIDRPDWVHGHLTNSGLWDFELNDFTLKRNPHVQTLQVINKWKQKLGV